VAAREAAGRESIEPMETARKYHQLALDCLQMAEATHDVAIQDQMIRMAELWARLADRAEDRTQYPRSEDGRAA